MSTQYRHHLVLTGKLQILPDDYARLLRFAIAAVIQLAPKESTPDTTTHPKP